MSDKPEHKCSPPDLSTADGLRMKREDEDWQCPECKQWWFIGAKNFCHSCYRSDGAEWEKFGTGDGKFPVVTAPRGGIVFKMTEGT